MRIWSIMAHVLAGALIVGTAISEVWLSLMPLGSGCSGSTELPPRSRCSGRPTCRFCCRAAAATLAEAARRNPAATCLRRKKTAKGEVEPKPPKKPRTRSWRQETRRLSNFE